MASSSTKRKILRQLCERPLRLDSGQEARITPVGKQMLYVSFVAERWLQGAPGRQLDFDGGESERAIVALAEGWSSTAIHALAREPLTFRELERAIPHLDPQGLERRLRMMRISGLVKVRPEGSDTGLYTATDWLREGIAPLAAAARLERNEPSQQSAPIDSLDVEAAFLLTLPLLELPAEISGACRLGVEIGEGGQPRSTAGVTAHVEGGRVSSCASRLDDEVGTWAIASAGDWLDTLIDSGARRVRTGGDRLLANALVGQLHNTLFGIATGERSLS